MSIASEITRLQQAKADIKTAIENKGVTVPSDAKLDDYADLVDSISSGGGSVDWEAIARGMIDDSTHFTVPQEAFGTTIRYYTFYARRFLDGVVLPVGLTEISNAAFQESSLPRIVVPSGVTKLGNSVFQGCQNLTSAILPDSITTAGMSIFYNCTNLESANIPAGLTILNVNFFYQCFKLTTMTIPSGITIINSKAFFKCTALAEVILEPTSPPTLQSDSFAQCSALTSIYVPDASISAYQSATNWTTYASKIKGISERPTT